MIKDLIRLKWQAGLSHEQIAATLNISQTSVAEYVALASATGLDRQTARDWSDLRLSAALLPWVNGRATFISSEPEEL